MQTNSFERNYDTRETNNTISQIKFNIEMVKLSFCDWSDACILLKGILIAADNSATVEAASNAHKKVRFKSCSPFTDCISE